MTVSNAHSRLNRHQIVAVATIAFAHIAIRVIGLFNNPRFEDHDSLAFVAGAKTFLSGNVEQIWGMNPDAVPLYPLLAAMVSIISGDPEIATRLISLLASIATLYCLFLLTRRIGGNWPAIMAIGLLALNPTFVRWSYSILTEPLYVAIVTAGITLFFAYYRKMTVWNGALLGSIFGLAFLTRLEGILFLGAIPLLLLANRALGNSTDSWSRVAVSTVSFISVFVLLAAPQVLRVSDSMNTFSLNGRTTWSLILNTPDDRSYSEKIYGLDYDPGTTNLLHLQSHPEEISPAQTSRDITSLIIGYTKTVLTNLEDLHHSVLSPLIGLPAIAFGMYGLLAIFLRGQIAEAMLLAAFISIGLAGPLLHNVNPRHIAVLGPLLILLTAIGIDRLLDSVRESSVWIAEHRSFASLGLAILCISPLFLDLGRVLMLRDEQNSEYSQAEIEMAVKAYDADIDAQNGTRKNIVARKSYFGHFANVDTILLPYTDLAGLLRFMQLNGASYLFLEERLAKDFPFVGSLKEKPEDVPLTLLFEHAYPPGGSVYLYRRTKTTEDDTRGLNSRVATQ